jgi:hypothetical protein
MRQPTRQQAVAAGGIIKTTGKSATSGGVLPAFNTILEEDIGDGVGG